MTERRISVTMTFHIGDKVGYNCVPALMRYKGFIVAIGATKGGGDCTIEWQSPAWASGIRAAEYTMNLHHLTPLQETPMPEYIVELSFEYRSTYKITAATPQAALKAAEVHDDVVHRGMTPPPNPGEASLEALKEREFADDLESRIFDDTGEEIEQDWDPTASPLPCPNCGRTFYVLFGNCGDAPHCIGCNVALEPVRNANGTLVGFRMPE
jgi:hypothetical protein